MDQNWSAVVLEGFSQRDSKGSLAIDSLQAESDRRGTAGQQQKILIVDDEKCIADSLTEILKRYGYDAVACYSGHSAIESARKRCPDIVVSDVMMPKVNGVETVLSIREFCPAIRVLLFSGQAGTADILKEARSRGHEFVLLPKPIHPDELLRKLEANPPETQ